MGTRKGLLHEQLMKRIEECWHTGEVAVYYVKLEHAWPGTKAALAEWKRQEPGLFWESGLEREPFYFVHYPAHGQASEPAAQTLERLRAALEGASSASAANGAAAQPPSFRLGTAAVPPPDASEAPEQAVFRQLLRAMAEAGRNRAAAPGEPLGANGSPDGSMARRAAIGKLSSPVPTFGSGVKVSAIAYMFEANPDKQAAVIVKENRPIGLVTKQKLHQLLAGQFGFALYANRPVDLIMDKQPLVVEEDETVEKVSQLATARDYSQLYDVVVTVRNGLVSGTVSIRDLLECITALRTEEARMASPLTGLPGNTGIRNELARRISAGRQFAVVYADVDYFKWFNDRYGFARGDDLIRYLGERIVAAFRECGDAFVGHVGGDDFIAVAKPDCAEAACRQLIASFDEGARRFYGEEGAAAAVDRNGRQVGQHGVTLSLSLLICDCGDHLSLEDISICAAELKKRAKAMPGSIYVTGELKSDSPAGNGVNHEAT